MIEAKRPTKRVEWTISWHSSSGWFYGLFSFRYGTQREGGRAGWVKKQPIFSPGQAHISDIRSRRRHLGRSIEQIHFELFELVYLLYCGSPQKRKKQECLCGQNNILLTRNALSFLAIITALRVFTHLGSISKVLLIESQFGVLMLICCCPDFLVPAVVWRKHCRVYRVTTTNKMNNTKSKWYIQRSSRWAIN